MLLRVATSIDHFPAHAPQLLTSTVVQCAKAKLWRSAHQHAVTLMRPELRTQLAAEHRKKVENLVRKKDDTYATGVGCLYRPVVCVCVEIDSTAPHTPCGAGWCCP